MSGSAERATMTREDLLREAKAARDPDQGGLRSLEDWREACPWLADEDQADVRWAWTMGRPPGGYALSDDVDEWADGPDAKDDEDDDEEDEAPRPSRRAPGRARPTKARVVMLPQAADESADLIGAMRSEAFPLLGARAAVAWLFLLSLAPTYPHRVVEVSARYLARKTGLGKNRGLAALDRLAAVGMLTCKSEGTRGKDRDTRTPSRWFVARPTLGNLERWRIALKRTVPERGQTVPERGQ